MVEGGGCGGSEHWEMFLQVPGVPPCLVYPHLSLSDHGQGGRHCPWGLIAILYFISSGLEGKVGLYSWVGCSLHKGTQLYTILCSPGPLPRLCPPWGCLFHTPSGPGSTSGGTASDVWSSARRAVLLLRRPRAVQSHAQSDAALPQDQGPQAS